uniref:GTP cyclohydrolase II n=1 Tax=Glaucocystis sp. BC-2016 TaxID=1802912 RepID=A0A126X104_9EUKA|nr:putative LOV domain-containing protein [Glaucocystis sp. BC-2016]
MVATQDLAVDACHRKFLQDFLWRHSQFEREGIVVTNTKEIIVYASDRFSTITGYKRKEILGRNCRFLQGTDTDPAAVNEIRTAINLRRSCKVGLLNYRKDGTQFWNLLSITPLIDSRGEVTNFAGASYVLCLVPSPLSDLRLDVKPWMSSNRLLEENESAVEVPQESGSSREEPLKTVFVAETRLPTCRGFYRVRAYRDSHVSHYEPLAIISGDVRGLKEVALRVHDQCVTSEVLGSLKCDCKEQLNYSLEYIREHGPGVVIYLQQEGRGIGLANKIAAYAMQERGYDTVDANRVLGLPDDSREYQAVKDILTDLEVLSVRLLTNNPRKICELQGLGVEVVSRVPIVLPSSEFSLGYLEAKAARMGHFLDDDNQLRTAELTLPAPAR